MLHIILFILKILGLMVLAVLGLILTLVLLILLVPVRYQAEGSYDGKVKGKARITWLLHILSVRVQYEEDVLATVRFFGFPIGKPKKLDSELKEAEEIMVQAMETVEPEAVKEVREVKDEVRNIVKEKPQEYLPPPREPKAESEEKTRKEQKEKPGGEKRFWVPKLLEKLKKKIFVAKAKLKFFFRRICDTLKTLKDKKDEILAFISDKNNQRTVRLLIRQGKKLFRHILPRKGKGNVTFGFEDPYLTGQVLTYASVVYPLCHKRLNLYPVFDRQVFTADGTFRGRISVGTILFIGSRMLFDKNFRRLLRKWLR